MEDLVSKIQNALTEGGPAAALEAAEGALKSLPQDMKVMGTVALSECQLGAGSADDALKTANAALELAQAAQNKQGEAMALLAAANATLFKDPAGAVALAQTAIERFEVLRDKRGHARALITISNGEQIPEKAREAALQASSLFRELGDKPGQGAALHAVMNAELLSFGPEAGLVAADNALRVARDMGSKKAEATFLNSISSMYLMKGAAYESVKAASDAFGVCKSLKDPSSFTDTLSNIFNVQFFWQNPDEAASFAGQAVHIFNDLSDQSGLAAMLQMLAVAQLKRGNTSEAITQANSCLDIYKGLKDRTGVLSALKTLVTVYANCEPVDASRMLEVAKDGVAFFKGLDDKRGVAAALHLVAAVHYATFTKKGEPKEARQATETAIAAYRSMQDTEGQAAVLQTALSASLSKGKLDEALRALKDLQSLYQAAGDKRAEAKTLDAMASLHLAKDNSRKALKMAQDALSMATALGDADVELDAMRTLASVYFVRGDGDGALSTAQDMLAAYQKRNDKSGEASAMVLTFRVQQLARLDEEALKTAYAGLAIQRDLDDKRGQLRMMELICASLLDRRVYSEAMGLAQDALALTRELHLRFSEGCAMFVIAKTNIASAEGIASANEAVRIFREAGYKKEAAIALHAVANGCLLMRAPARDAIAAAAEGLNLYKEVQDSQGEAVMMHTIANCQLALKEMDNAINTAYEAMQMFSKVGDTYGVSLAKKLLVGAGQSEEEIRERREQQLAQFDGVETRATGETDEERRRQEDEARDLQDTQVLWELAWIPWETQDPKNFGEKFAGGTRKIFVASELQDKSMLKKLMKCRPAKSTPGGGTPYFSNLLNGRLLNKDTLQFGMQASSAMSVVYDVSKLTHHGALEVIDLVLKLVQALVPIEERKVGLDMITSSCMNLAYTAGVQEPFHSTLFGFARAARNENPMHEFRLLDVDPGRRLESMPFICRYLLGAQTTRPAEALVRDRGVMVSRLVGARSKLNLPVRIELEAR